MKKYLSLVLALLLALSCVACGGDAQPTETTTAPTENTSEPTTETTSEPTEEQIATSPLAYLQLSISEEDGSMVSITAFDDDMGNAYIEYVGAEKKMANMDLSLLKDIQAELEKSGMIELAGMDEYKDGEAFASMYIAYEDETSDSANFGGEIPQSFRDAYAVMDAYFQKLTADVEVYVPRPLIMGEVNEDAQAALEAILDASGAEPLDMFSISDIPLDFSFPAMMGLTGMNGITAGTACAPMMSAIAFSCMVVNVEDESKIDAVAKDFAANVNWERWVCVSADEALVASKDQMVLCLAGTDALYQQFADAIESTGWTVIETLTK